MICKITQITNLEFRILSITIQRTPTLFPDLPYKRFLFNLFEPKPHKKSSLVDIFDTDFTSI